MKNARLIAAILCAWISCASAQEKLNVEKVSSSAKLELTTFIIKNEAGEMTYQKGLRRRNLLPNGHEVTYEYDDLGQFTKSTYSTGEIHYAARDVFGKLIGVRSTDGRKLVIARKGRLVKITITDKVGKVENITAAYMRNQSRILASKKASVSLAQGRRGEPLETTNLMAGGGCSGGGSYDDDWWDEGAGCDSGGGGEYGGGGAGGGDTGNTGGDTGAPGDTGSPGNTGMPGGDDSDDPLPEGEGNGEPWPPTPPPPPPPWKVQQCYTEICDPANETFEENCREIPYSNTKERAFCWAAAANRYGRCRKSCATTGDYNALYD